MSRRAIFALGWVSGIAAEVAAIAVWVLIDQRRNRAHHDAEWDNWRQQPVVADRPIRAVP